VEKLYYGVFHLLSPLIVFALPSIPISVICAVFGVSLKNRTLVITAACCGLPMCLYALAGRPWWRPVIPIVIVMYFGAAYVLPKHRALAAALIVPYFIFLAIIVNALYFRH
jgi:hypothetical protein